MSSKLWPDQMQPETDGAERRREIRYPLEAKVLVHKGSGETVPATATNISSSGMLLRVEEASKFDIDEVVSVEVELPEDAGRLFSAWGIARVARVDGHSFGIQLYGGAFESGDWVRI